MPPSGAPKNLIRSVTLSHVAMRRCSPAGRKSMPYAWQRVRSTANVTAAMARESRLCFSIFSASKKNLYIPRLPFFHLLCGRWRGEVRGF